MKHAVPVGDKCAGCGKTEQECAHDYPCCASDSHWKKVMPAAPSVGCPAINAVVVVISSGRCRFRVQCLDCWKLTSAHRLISQAMAEHAVIHGQHVTNPSPKAA